jgi:hypothetical protein
VYNETVLQLFIDFKKIYDSVRREVLYNIFIEFGVPMKLVRLIKMCLNKTYSKVHIGKYLSDIFYIQNGLKQGEVLSPLLFNFALEYAIRKVQENQVGLKLNGTYQLVAYVDDVKLLGDNIDTIKKNTGTLTNGSKEVGLEIHVENICICSCLTTKIITQKQRTNNMKMCNCSNTWERQQRIKI